MVEHRDRSTGRMVDGVSIQILAKCDGPDCDVEKVVQDKIWPNDFTVINLKQSRHQMAKPTNPTGDYGFCSQDCIIRWAGGRSCLA